MEALLFRRLSFLLDLTFSQVTYLRIKITKRADSSHFKPFFLILNDCRPFKPISFKGSPRMPPKPTVLFIPGAWFKVAAYNIFLSSLRNIGYPVTASEYPSLNPAPNDHDIGCARDTSYLRDKFLLPLVDEQSKDVVLVMHSYGGMPGAGAAQGLSKKLRKRSGKDGGVVGLIMISALVVPPAISCAGSMGGDTSPWVIKDVVSSRRPTTLV